MVALAVLAATCSSGGRKAAAPAASPTSAGGSAGPSGPRVTPTAAASTLATTTTTTSSLNKSVAARAGGLSITLAVAPARASRVKAISFNLSAQEREAHGALEYQIFYGDGKTDQNPAPQYCVSVASPAQEIWTLSHRYTAPGTYMVILTAWANCTRDRARTQAVAVTIT